MKSWFFLVTLILFSIGILANPTRNTIHLKDSGWQLDNNEPGANPSLAAGQEISAEIELDESDVQFATISIFDGAKLFSVFINDEKINNELTDDDFHADITPFIEGGNFTLKLVANSAVTADILSLILENAQLALLNNVFICHVEMLEDPFFGGKMVVAMVKNMLSKDVDGKLIANVLNIKTMDLVAENNNCAFSRQGSEIVIDINFPDAETIEKGHQYLLEISMVDKENNEAVIDELIVPVRF